MSINLHTGGPLKPGNTKRGGASSESVDEQDNGSSEYEVEVELIFDHFTDAYVFRRTLYSETATGCGSGAHILQGHVCPVQLAAGLIQCSSQRTKT